MAQDTTNNWCDRAWNGRRRTSLCLAEQLKVEVTTITGQKDTKMLMRNAHLWSEDLVA